MIQWLGCQIARHEMVNGDKRPINGDRPIRCRLFELACRPLPQTIEIPYHAAMSSSVLYAPWRMDYIRSLDGKPGACFLCAAAATADQPAERQRDVLLLWSTTHSIVVINRYPYANGHLLVAPRAHKAEIGELSDEEGLDLHRQTAVAIDLLRRAVSAQGFNLGINLGRLAGAGVPEHVHQHVVPRWNGDTNFMSVVGDVRIVPQAMGQLYDELIRVRQGMGVAGNNGL